jgi:hypothetical protein
MIGQKELAFASAGQRLGGVRADGERVATAATGNRLSTDRP